jgi:hypothetical protein
VAIKTSLRLIARELSQAVEAAAKAQGLTPQDYALFGSFFENSEHISLRFLTTRPIDKRRLYSDTFDRIRRAFPRDPQVVLYTSLVVTVVGSEDEFYRDSLGSEDETDITPLLEKR